MRKYITISREFGSGGRFIGKQVAESLGISFYDREIIDMTAEHSGLSAEFIEKTEQSISSGFLYNLLLGTSYAGSVSPSANQAINSSSPILPLADQVFNAERKTIIDIAKKGPCVIVGRCADYILSTCDEIDASEVLNVFIYADMDDKITRIKEIYKLDVPDTKKHILQIDKRRANHYNTFTENTWGARQNYDLMLNSTAIGIENTARLICEYTKHAK